MQNILGNSSSAVRAHTRGLMVSAHNTANLRTPNFKPLDTAYLSAPSGGVRAKVTQSPEATGSDLPKEIVNTISSARAIEANVAVIRASDKTLGVLLDTVG